MKIGWMTSMIPSRAELLSSIRGYIPNRFIEMPEHPYTEYDVSLTRIRDVMKQLAAGGCTIIRENYWMTPKMQHVVWNSDPTLPCDFSRVTDWEACRLILELAREYGMTVNIVLDPQGKPEFGGMTYSYYLPPNVGGLSDTDPGAGKRTWYEETPAGAFTTSAYKCKAYYYWLDKLWIPWLTHLCHFLSDYADVVWIEPTNELENVLAMNNFDDWQPRSYDLVKSINPNLQYGLPSYPYGAQSILGGGGGGGYAHVPHGNQFDCLIAVNRQDAFDRWAPMHFYTTPDPEGWGVSLSDVTADISRWKAKLAAMGRSDVKIFINEMSDVTGGNWTEQSEALTGLKDYVISQDIDALTFFFAFLPQGTTQEAWLEDNPSTCPEAGSGYWYAFDGFCPVFNVRDCTPTPLYNTLLSWNLPNQVLSEALVSVAYAEFNRVIIDWPTSAAVKKYRVDGGAWTDYTTSIPITHDGMVVDYYSGNGSTTEATKSGTFNREAIAPMTAATPEHGVLKPGVSGRDTIVLTNDCPGHSTIHMTLDGSTPTVGSPVYSGPLTYTPGMDLRYMSVDEWGNAEAPKKLTVVDAKLIYMHNGQKTITPVEGDTLAPGIIGGFYGVSSLYSPQTILYNTLETVDTPPPTGTLFTDAAGNQSPMYDSNGNPVTFYDGNGNAL